VSVFLSVVLVLGESVLDLFTEENALEEVRTLLEQAVRGRCTVEQELSDTNETLSDQTCTNQAIEGPGGNSSRRCKPSTSGSAGSENRVASLMWMTPPS
jgi:hypothetical protein